MFSAVRQDTSHVIAPMHPSKALDVVAEAEAVITPPVEDLRNAIR